MHYYHLLNLSGEPFSNTPDPSFFFRSRQHAACLHALEIAIRLRRGLNVVIGAIGTGKTTLCRQLLNVLHEDTAIEAHLILDPVSESQQEFLTLLEETIVGRAEAASTLRRRKERIKEHLLDRAAETGRIVLLAIDEGQKLAPDSLEILREILNFETNEHKLLQIVIFAQPEFSAMLAGMPNVADRINLLHHLGPMGYRDTREMIEFRVRRVSTAEAPARLFTLPAYRAVYWATQGYPRKILNLCHKSLLRAIVQDKRRVTWSMVRADVIGLAEYALRLRQQTRKLALSALAVCCVIASAMLLLFFPEFILRLPAPDQTSPASAIRAGERDPVVLPASAVAAVHAGSEHGPVSEGGMPGDTFVLPDTLGELSVRSGENLSRLVRLIYGTVTPGYLRSMEEANPWIKDIDTLPVGTRVVFPAQAVDELPPHIGPVLLVQTEKPDLDQAMQEYRKIGSPSELVLLPYWTQTKGFRVAIAHPGFSSRNEAMRLLELLPPEIRPSARVVDSWEPETRFFTP